METNHGLHDDVCNQRMGFESSVKIEMFYSAGWNRVATIR
jgi:hypothetical protein